MRVLVTGGAGFIGSNLVPALLAGGHSVAVVDNLSVGTTENLDPRAEFRQLDILDPAFGDYVRRYAPDAVVHLAAQASVTASLRDPEADRLTNAEGTRRVAAAAREGGARRVISASSAAVYGEPPELPLKETSAKEPLNPYGCSKLEAEGLIAEELAGSDVDHASFRFSNVYGPRQDALGEGGVVAIFLGRIRSGLAPIVYGDGRQTRDFIYVGDLVEAIVQALQWDGRLDASGPAYNISTCEGSSVDELIDAIRAASGYAGEIEYEDARTGDIVHSLLDPSLASRVFGWRSSVDLKSGVAMTWRWFSSQG